MDNIDARKLSLDALKALRSQAVRLRHELGLPWREIARVMGLNTTAFIQFLVNSPERVKSYFQHDSVA